MATYEIDFGQIKHPLELEPLGDGSFTYTTGPTGLMDSMPLRALGELWWNGPDDVFNYTWTPYLGTVVTEVQQYDDQ